MAVPTARTDLSTTASSNSPQGGDAIGASTGPDDYLRAHAGLIKANYDDILLRAPIASPTFTGTVAGVTAAMVGLGNVTNESKATMFASPTFTGTAHLPATQMDNSAITEIKTATLNSMITQSVSTNTQVDFANGQFQQLTTSGACAITFSFPGVGVYWLDVQSTSGPAATLPAESATFKYTGGATATVATGGTLVGLLYDGTRTIVFSKTNFFVSGP
jgi:hypothetical protein